MTTKLFHGIRPDALHGRMGLANPERGFRNEMYASLIPGEIAGMCSAHFKELKLDGRPLKPVYVNRLIRGNRLDAVEFAHCQWQDELDYLAYDGVTMMQSYIYLMKFSDGRDLSGEKLEDIKTFLDQVRRRGVKVLLRFAYELRPRTLGPTAKTILRHLEMLKPLIRCHSDVISVLQCGFVGIFGEWHNSINHLEDDIAFHRELFAAVLETLPEDRMTMVRYPAIKRRVFGNEPVNEKNAFSSIPIARIGHFNDGFLAGPGHGGTFREEPFGKAGNPDFDLVSAESRYLPVDGELFWNDLQGVAEPFEAVSLFRSHHYNTFSFVHGNIQFQGEPYSIDLWRNTPADPGALADGGLPISDGYFFDSAGNPVLRSYYEYIRDHLGYRFELQRIDLPETVSLSERISCNLLLINRGFASPVNYRPVFLLLEGDAHSRFIIPFDTDVRRWYPAVPGDANPLEHRITLAVALPPGISPGHYQAGIWLPDAAEALRNRPEYAIRFANDLEYRDGINFIGELQIV